MTLNVATAGIGTNSTLSLYKGPMGELSFASDSKKLVVHDGATPGGIITLTLVVADAAPAITPGFVGQIWFDKTAQITYISKGTASSSDWAIVGNGADSGLIQTADIADGAVTSAKLALNAVQTNNVAAEAITTGQLALGAVTEAVLAANAISSVKLADGAVIANKIDNAAVTEAKLAGGSVSTAKLAVGAVDADRLAANSVTAVKLSAGAVEADKLAANAVTTNALAANAVTAGKIATGSITAGDGVIASLGVGKLVAGTLAASGVYIGTPQIELDGVNAKIVVKDTQTVVKTRVELGKLGAGTADYGIIIRNAAGNVVVGADGLGLNVVGDSQITSITAEKITTGTLGASVVYAGSLSAGQINTGTLSASRIATGSLSANHINASSGTFDSANIPNLNASKITTGTLGAGVVYAGTVNANQINAGTLAAGVIYSGSISANQITAGTFTGSTFQTASSGTRMVIDSSTNTIKFINSSGVETFSVGGNVWGASLVAKGDSTPAIIASTTVATAVTMETTATGSNSTAMACRMTTANNTQTLHVLKSANAGSASHCIRVSAPDPSHGVGVIGVANTYFAYAERGGYGPFTGVHDGLIPSTLKADLGDILVDVEVVGREGVSDCLTTMDLSRAPMQKIALGVLAGRRPLDDDIPLAAMIGSRDQNGRPKRKKHKKVDEGAWDHVNVNALGEGLINVCNEGGDIQAGDLIVTSSVPGKGMRQADDIMRSYTVARARESYSFKNKNDIGLIACIYHCG